MRRLEQPSESRALFLGNSLMAAAIDEAAFAAAWQSRGSCPAPLNAGLGSSSPVEHLLLLRHALRHGPRPALVIYGVFDHQLTDPYSQGIGEALVGNRAMCYYTEPELAADLLRPESSLYKLRLRLTARVPILVESATLHAKVELLRRQVGRRGLPAEDVNRFGRAADFTALEANSVSEFEQKCISAVASSRPLSAALIALLSTAREAGARVVVCEMPMPLRHRRMFYASPEWRLYQSHVRAQVESLGSEYVEFSSLVPDSEFDDHLHMSRSGAGRFSRMLASALSRC